MTSDLIGPGVQGGTNLIAWLTCIFTGIGMVILLAYTVYTKRLAEFTQKSLEQTIRSNEATEESNKIAERNLDLSKRSWLVIDPKPTLPNPKDRGALFSSVDLRNVGGVPAIIRRHGWGFVPGDPPEQFELDADHSTPSGMVVFGDLPRRAEFRRTLDEGERRPIGDLLRKSAYLYVYWIVEYSDCLGDDRRTIQCWRSNDPEGGWWEATEPQCNRLE